MAFGYEFQKFKKFNCVKRVRCEVHPFFVDQEIWKAKIICLPL